jgi:hypothetical protein
MFLLSLLVLPLMTNARGRNTFESTPLTEEKLNQAIEAAQASLSITYNRFQVKLSSSISHPFLQRPSSIVK